MPIDPPRSAGAAQELALDALDVRPVRHDQNRLARRARPGSARAGARPCRRWPARPAGSEAPPIVERGSDGCRRAAGSAKSAKHCEAGASCEAGFPAGASQARVTASFGRTGPRRATATASRAASSAARVARRGRACFVTPRRASVRYVIATSRPCRLRFPCPSVADENGLARHRFPPRCQGRNYALAHYLTGGEITRPCARGEFATSGAD